MVADRTPRDRSAKARVRNRAIWQGQQCHYCTEPAASIDHVVPLCRGGSDTVDNIVPACRSCNARKNAGTRP